MEASFDRIIAELEQWGQENDARETERSRKMLNLEPETARLLSLLVKSGQRTRLLEVGTSNGYSLLWLARAAQQTGGHVHTIEQDPEKQTLAKANLERAGLQTLATLHLGDATHILRTLSGPFDFVFLDAERTQYPALLPLLLPKLSPNALLLADNVHSHPDEIAPYLAAINANPQFEHVVLDVGKGLSIALNLI